MSDEERWTSEQFAAVQKHLHTLPADRLRPYLDALASYIVSLAADVGATDWPATLHLGDVVEKHIGRACVAARAGAAEDKA